MKVVGICGVSGSGKSTIANYLASEYPKEVTLLSLDDYFKKASEVGKDWCEINWEDPSVIKFDKLIEDIKKLKIGKSIKVFSKSKFYNPDFDYEKYNKVEVEIHSKEIIVLEGFLIFVNEELRNLIDVKVYLDLNIEDGLKRRVGDKHPPSGEYIENYIIPSFTENILEKKKYADFVIHVKSDNINLVKTKIQKILGLN